jgi:hypothetical protein
VCEFRTTFQNYYEAGTIGLKQLTVLILSWFKATLSEPLTFVSTKYGALVPGIRYCLPFHFLYYKSCHFFCFRGIHYLCEINVKQTFQCEDALKLLLNILTLEGHKCWTYYSGPEDFNNLMVKFCREFSLLQVRYERVSKLPFYNFLAAFYRQCSGSVTSWNGF